MGYVLRYNTSSIPVVKTGARMRLRFVCKIFSYEIRCLFRVTMGAQESVHFFHPGHLLLIFKDQKVGVPPVRGRMVYLFCVRKGASLSAVSWVERGHVILGFSTVLLTHYDEKHSPLIAECFGLRTLVRVSVSSDSRNPKFRNSGSTKKWSERRVATNQPCHRLWMIAHDHTAAWPFVNNESNRPNVISRLPIFLWKVTHTGQLRKGEKKSKCLPA